MHKPITAIVHTAWPLPLPEKDLQIYYGLLSDAFEYHQGSFAHEKCEVKEPHFKIIFVYDSEEEKSEMEKTLNAYAG